MPKVDFPNLQIPSGYTLPEPPITLVEGLSDAELTKWVHQELYHIYNSTDSYLIKEMKKEDIYYKLIEANYDIG